MEQEESQPASLVRNEGDGALVVVLVQEAKTRRVLMVEMKNAISARVFTPMVVFGGMITFPPSKNTSKSPVGLIGA